jgi:hypothetical protein
MITLKNVQETLTTKPFRALFYGPHKIGKSTFASGAKNPIFIQTEDGLNNIQAKAFPLCTKWQDVLDCISALYKEDHKYNTVVLDSCDWAERLCNEAICKENNVDSIEKIGYGRGYSFSADKFNELLMGLNALRLEKNMNIIILCHCEIKRFDDPMTDSYDRYQIKLHKNIGKLVQEWSDLIGFAQQEMATKVEKSKGFKDDRVIPVDLGNRVLRLQGAANYDAGSRYDMPATIPLVWSEFEKALNVARGLNNT